MTSEILKEYQRRIEILIAENNALAGTIIAQKQQIEKIQEEKRRCIGIVDEITKTLLNDKKRFEEWQK